MKKNIIFFIAFFSLPMILFGQQYQDYFKSGKQKMENYQFNEAIRDLDMVINLNRESSGMSKQISRSIALILKSYCLFYLGNFDSSLASINEYKICASWDRNQSDVMLIKAQIEYYQKNYRSALLNINSYISKRKKSSLGYYVRAFIFESLSQQENALKDYRKVIELDKSSLVKALSLQKVGLYEKAIIMIHEIIKKEPQKAENKYTEALIEFSEKKSDAGYFMLETAMQGGYKPPILTLCLEVFNVTDSERFKELLAKYDIPNLKGERAKQEKEIKEGVELVAFNQIKAKATVFYANEIKQELVKSPLFSPKDEFESQSAYQDRLKKAEDYKSEVQKKYVALYKEYSERKESERIEKIKNSYTHVDLKITGLGTYNVEKQIFPVTIEGLNIKDRLLFDMELGVPLQDAKSFKENLKDVKVIAERQLKDDALNYHCFNFEVTHPVTGVKYTLASYTPLYLDYVSKDMAESGVPKLDATVKFIEPSGNNLLDGEEKAKFEVTIKNAGTGSAQNIKVNLSTIDNNGFTYEKNKSLTGIAPNQSQTVIFELNADRKINSKEIPFKFDITESRGFNPAGILYSINTQAFKTPNLTVKDIGIKEVTGNNNSIIENGEKIEVSVLVQNTGQGKTENTKAVFDISDKNILSLSPDRMIQNVGALNPGESRLLTFDFTVNNIYAGSDLLPIKVVLSEKYNEYGGTFPLKLEMKKVQLATKNIKVSGLYDQKIEIKDISLTAETDKNIPETATKNPYRFALIIGNEDYKSFQPDLNGEVNVLFAGKRCENIKGICCKNLRCTGGEYHFANQCDSRQNEPGIGKNEPDRQKLKWQS